MTLKWTRGYILIIHPFLYHFWHRTSSFCFRVHHRGALAACAERSAQEAWIWGAGLRGKTGCWHDLTIKKLGFNGNQPSNIGTGLVSYCFKPRIHGAGSGPKKSSFREAVPQTWLTLESTNSEPFTSQKTVWNGTHLELEAWKFSTLWGPRLRNREVGEQNQ